MEKEVLIVHSASEALNLKERAYERLDEEILKEFIKKIKGKNKKDSILAIKSAGIALKIKSRFKALSKKEVIQKVLDEIKEA